MEKQIRNLIQKATQDARNLLESEFNEQLEGVFDILPNGRIAPEPGEHLNAGQRIIREKVVAAIEHEKAGGVSDEEAVSNYLREASFTCLNRFAALKMLEARELVQELIPGTQYLIFSGRNTSASQFPCFFMYEETSLFSV
ncbi:MAG: hypothetical protein HN366_19395 [Deltaproteobacteria bacterium]|jgi:hypothetical protein|nr:hypothetical protein [Deltaproteobacteria bacterium]